MKITMDGMKKYKTAITFVIAALKTEKEGFEPSVEVLNPYNRLAICRLRPLGHFSISKAI